MKPAAKPPAMTAQQLRATKNKYDLSTDDLCAALALHRRMVYYLLAGRRRITAQHAKALYHYIRGCEAPSTWNWK